MYIGHTATTIMFITFLVTILITCQRIAWAEERLRSRRFSGSQPRRRTRRIWEWRSDGGGGGGGEVRDNSNNNNNDIFFSAERSDESDESDADSNSDESDADAESDEGEGAEGLGLGRDLLTVGDIRPRIIDGRTVIPFSKPYNVALMEQQEKGTDLTLVCGGVLVARDVIFVAAHCLTQHRIDVILVGRHDLERYEPSGQTFTSFTTFLHSLHVPKSALSPSLVYDYGFIFLDDGDTVKGIEPIRINDNRIIPATGQSIVATGWGRTEAGSTSPLLKRATLRSVPNSRCGRFFRDDTILCAKYVTGSTCFGDSGSPAIIEQQQQQQQQDENEDEDEGGGRNTDLLVGVTSFLLVRKDEYGRYQCLPGQPMGFTRVTEQIFWIRSVLCSHTKYPDESGCDPLPRVTLVMELDNSPRDTAFVLSAIHKDDDDDDEEDDVVDLYVSDGGRYADQEGGALIVQTIYLYDKKYFMIGDEQEYLFSMLDFAGNGLCCDDGNGKFQLWFGENVGAENGGILLGEGSDFGMRMSITFTLDHDGGLLVPRNDGSRKSETEDVSSSSLSPPHHLSHPSVSPSALPSMLPSISPSERDEMTVRMRS